MTCSFQVMSVSVHKLLYWKENVICVWSHTCNSLIASRAALPKKIDIFDGRTVVCYVERPYMTYIAFDF